VFTCDDAPATEAGLRPIEEQIGYRLPEELRRVLTLASRPEGFVGESYIAFFNTDDLIRNWRDAQPLARGFVPFASNGGGEWYGFDSRLESPATAFLLMPSIGMEWGVATFLGANWEEFWETLKRGNLFDHDYQFAQK
jgi:hypothetical protein